MIKCRECDAQYGVLVLADGAMKQSVGPTYRKSEKLKKRWRVEVECRRCGHTWMSVHWLLVQQHFAFKRKQRKAEVEAMADL